MKRQLVGDELVVMALHSFPFDKKVHFKDHLYSTMHKLSLREEYKPFFRDYAFDLDGVLCYSPEIEEAFYGIMLRSGLVSFADDGSTLNAFYFSPAIGISYEHIKKNMTSQEIGLAVQMSQELREMLT